MFGGQIATAFVRIRPNMAGFQAETETGVRHAFSKVAEIVGLALGARAAYNIVKSSIAAAAGLQKSMEVVRSQFGQAGQSLIQFANVAGTSFGAINSDTLAASARFGILFQNLGIGPQLAAQMTKGFEQLALATNAIKGGSPGDAANLLNILAKGAATGRGLNQLGIVLSSTQEQVAAFKLGLTQTVTQALTPAQKAVAIYAIATQNLGDRIRHAKAHFHDFADVQSTLTAEWAKAKEELGSALLPQVRSLVTQFSNWLNRMERSGQLQRDFNSIAHTTATVVGLVVDTLRTGVHLWEAFSKAVGGARHAIELLVALKLTSTFAGLAVSLTRLIGTAGAAGAGAAAGEGAGLTGAAAAASKLRLALLQLQGLAIVATIEVVVLETLKGYLKGYQDLAHKAAANAPQYGDLYKHVAAEIIAMEKRGIPSDEVFKRIYKEYGGRGAGQEKLLAEALDYIATLHGQKATGYLKQYLDEQSKRLAEQSRKALDAARKVSATTNDVLNRIHAALQATIDRARNAIAASIRSAKNNLVTIGDDLAKTILKIQEKIGGAAGAIAGSPQGQAFAKLKKLIESGAPTFQIQRAQEALSSQLSNVGKTQATVLKTQIDNLTAAFNSGKIGYSTFESRLHEILRKNGVTLKEALKAGGPAFADTFKAQVAALGKQAQAIAAIPAKYRNVGGAGGAADIKIIQPLQTIRDETVRIAAAAQKARQAQLKATEATNQILRNQTRLLKELGGSPHAKGFHKERKGKGSHDARKGAAAGYRG